MPSNVRSEITPHDNMGVTPLTLYQNIRSEKPVSGTISYCFASTDREQALRIARLFYVAVTKLNVATLRAHDAYDNYNGGTTVTLVLYARDKEAVKFILRQLERFAS